MEIKKIEEIIKVFEKSSLSELELEEKNFKMHVLKNTATSVVESKIVSSVQHNDVIEEVEEVQENLHAIKAPVVGTFYAKHSPNSENIVNIDDHVNKGDTLCIIEAMKVMNEIKSDVSGTIKEILLENNSSVEFDQVLFLIEED